MDQMAEAEIEEHTLNVCIGSDYQAEIPALRKKSLAVFDQDGADFISDPLEQEGASKEHDDWTLDEKVLLSRGMSRYGKNFFKIHKMIKTKTTAQCITFYYANKKHAKIGRKKNLIFSSETPKEAKTSRKRKIQSGEEHEENGNKKPKHSPSK
ncbi:REST corepressor 1-like [Xenopus tropicalis]|uniref:REST corepressor 1-like n=1 Tax=Xenopus tropicalis TaxID=8364 RepID=A0A8J1J2Z7_XENTR|nr:REST corepressor 1-like [Xenopus tropicalis]